jgi:hypothetical protein
MATDTQIYAATLEIIEACEQVEQTWIGATPPHDFTEESYPLVWLRPLRWEQEEDTDPPEPVRTCRFELRIYERAGEGSEAFLRIVTIGEALVEAIQHQGLSGAIPARTLFSKARHESANQVEVLVIEGSFATLRDQPQD